MPGPFPGVDPYLEAQHYWPDFHLKFLNYWQEALSDCLPDEYEVRVEERVHLVDRDAEQSALIRPDIAIMHTAKPGPSGAGRVAILEPETIPTTIYDEDREVFLKIVHRPDRKLITVLELLSPTNKIEPGYRDYLSRRNAILWQQVHLVELDLLIAGHRLPMQRPLPPGHFFAIIARWEQRPDCQVYAWTLLHRLPKILIPLKAPDPDISIDLAEVYTTAFDRGRCARSVDYRASLELPIHPEDRSWAEETARAFQA